MPFEIDASGRRRHVTVERAGEGFAVTLDGRSYHVDAARIDGHAPWLLSLIVDNGVADGPQVPVPVAISGRGRAPRDEAGSEPGAGPQRVHAPMPGKVVRVLVQAGDIVSARQPLVVVEAMKMENELRAGRDGTVAGVHAFEGASVEAGALLVVIE